MTKPSQPFTLWPWVRFSSIGKGVCMWVVSDVTSAREAMASIKATAGFVPTMGALHAGHLSLIEQAKAKHDHVVVSIFVNPAQFAPHEDLSRYPRPLERDLQLCEKAGVAGVFHPTVEAMYPPGLPPCEVSVPAMAADLEGAIRPGHFAGVCRVVAKLFNILQPQAAYFGEKDLQQLLVIQAMVADLNIPVRIVPCATLREDDGLAMSSRNVYLSAAARKHALGLSKALQEARRMVNAGETDATAVEAAMRQVMVAHHVQVDYAVVRHAHNLQAVACIEPAANQGVAALVAGRVESVRLIDNTRL